MTFALTQTGPAAGSSSRVASACSDDMLVARIAGGDRLAMQILFARHRVAVYRWLVRIARDEALAEDLLSEVFLDVWRQAAKFQARSSVSTWLLAIARYKALSARRRRVDAELTEAIATTIADSGDDPELALQKKTRDELLRRALAKLPAEHSGVIDLVYYHGKSVRDVADILGIPEATVKSRMFYARKKLAALMKTAW
jgi:RNA polymerase sigma-70 factor (ECF subfamily)